MVGGVAGGHLPDRLLMTEESGKIGASSASRTTNILLWDIKWSHASVGTITSPSDHLMVQMHEVLNERDKEHTKREIQGKNCKKRQ